MRRTLVERQRSLERGHIHHLIFIIALLLASPIGHMEPHNKLGHKAR